MSHSLPAPPPAPQPNQNGPKLVTTSTTKNLIDECLWAEFCPELQKACFLAHICPVRSPRKCQFRNISGILQSGPTCGLTALSMVLDGVPGPQELLATAKELNYTNNGEMFSAQNLFQLICDNLHLPPTDYETPQSFAKECNSSDDVDQRSTNGRNVIECQMHEGRLNCAKVKECLCAGSCLFVPYDPDFNHAPCLKFGHKAHWALIVGYLLDETDEFYVLARHGKAKNLAVWSLAALSESNSNLVEFAQPKGYPDCDFVLPPGGIGGDLGLRERAIIVSGLPHQIITIR